ncbi:MAG: patatin-like phospholipase family protein [Myxococcales bacterium]|nr:MAG: patatin-like phospholipase family protein [Myxococcales bacterium]
MNWAKNVRGVWVEPSPEEVIEQLAIIPRLKRTGKIALCLAGGGSEGLLYELGVLRAFERFLPERPIIDFDLFCGISAGAIIGGLLANGIGPDEILEGMSGKESRVSPISRREIYDINLPEFRKRLLHLAKGMWARSLAEDPISSLGEMVPSGIFKGEGLSRWLEKQFNRPGMSNHFDGLRKPLFIGATDQDSSKAVVFGEENFKHVPLHKAIRASAALAPFYAPEEIGGRYYIDGAFTRTTNMRVAVNHGATLVILVDPLVPLLSRNAGYVFDRGGLFGTLQGLKAIVNGRFDKTVYALREMFPDVHFHLFRPEGEEMRLMAGSPMKVFLRKELADVAYASTTEKIRSAFPKLRRDFAEHGVLFRDPEEIPETRTSVSL